jgi:CheY-like chemotaxis protein
VTPNGHPGLGGPILVVDDDTVSRLVLAHMLRGLGFEVVQADDLGPALELLGTTHFAVVFSDYSMPGGTGLQLFETLRNLPSRPSFVLVTGIVDRAGHGEPGGDSVDAHLAKPVSTRSLRACLRTIESRVPSP